MRTSIGWLVLVLLVFVYGPGLAPKCKRGKDTLVGVGTELPAKLKRGKDTLTYVGTWKTTNPRKKIDGKQTAEVNYIGDDKWEARFFGQWQGQSFDYVVQFKGPKETITGTATIDGADYTWTGSIDATRFKGEFTGTRYDGSFDMSIKPK